MDENEEIIPDCLFCKIRNGSIPTEFTYQDESVMVFPDIHPMKPTHLLIVPKKHVKEFVEVDDMGLLASLGAVIQRMIRQFGLGNTGYKIMINGGGHQIVDHLHIHLMGPMGRTN